MDKTHAIIWTATQGVRWGLGTKRFSKDEAETLASQLNEEHTQFLHRVIDMASEEPAVVLVAMRSAVAPREAQIIDYPGVMAMAATA